ncbi:general odorant-binding protein 1-like [Achroia grisella]|uniref:general odorant-binding protein 1-like n=1 Tax=Achroia grisella TaxID=688607 RepID=UPI0027D312BC|nr:general odorant-binding protein 1-like [Achroia grisella]
MLIIVNSSAEVMKKLSITFAKEVDVCQKELNVGDNIMQEMQNFWREEYDLVHRDTGCMILCMASKHNLLVIADEKIHHQNAHEFAKAHGADDEMATQLVNILHDCEKQYPPQDDVCLRSLAVAKCFRTKIHSLKWAPSMEELLAEIMTEM